MTTKHPADFGQWMYEFDLGDGVTTPVYLESLKQVHAVRRDMIFGFLDAAASTTVRAPCSTSPATRATSCSRC